MRRSWVLVVSLLIVGLALVSGTPGVRKAEAQASGPSMTVPNLGVKAVAEDFVTPIAIAFIGAGDMLVLEKNTGQIKRVVNGVVQGTVLDLAVNNAAARSTRYSERRRAGGATLRGRSRRLTGSDRHSGALCLTIQSGDHMLVSRTCMGSKYCWPA